MKWIQAALLFCVAATLVSAQCPGEMPFKSGYMTVEYSEVLPLDFPSCFYKQINSVKVSSPDGSTITVDVANNVGGISSSMKSGKTSCYNSFSLKNNYPPYGTGTAITVTCENFWYDCPIQYYIEYETCGTSNDDSGGEPVPVQDIDCQFGYVADAGAKCVGDGEDGTCASDGYGSISESLKIYTQPTGNGKACPTKTKQTKKCPMDICPIDWTGMYRINSGCSINRCCCLSGMAAVYQEGNLVHLQSDLTGQCGGVPSVNLVMMIEQSSLKEATFKLMDSYTATLNGDEVIITNHVDSACSGSATLVSRSVSRGDGSSDDSKLGLYIGVGVGGLAVVVLVVVGAVTIQRRRAATRGA